MSLSLLLAAPPPQPRATFPSYDLCFPALPEKKEEGNGREGGPTIQVGYLEVGGEASQNRIWQTSARSLATS